MEEGSELEVQYVTPNAFKKRMDIRPLSAHYIPDVNYMQIGYAVVSLNNKLFVPNQ